ncbi:hypothetical protein D3C73_798950 [compost metagenome]
MIPFNDVFNKLSILVLAVHRHDIRERIGHILQLQCRSQLDIVRYGEVPLNRGIIHILQRPRSLCRLGGNKFEVVRIRGNVSKRSLQRINVVFQSNPAHILQHIQGAEHIHRLIRQIDLIAILHFIQAVMFFGIQPHWRSRHLHYTRQIYFFPLINRLQI